MSVTLHNEVYGNATTFSRPLAAARRSRTAERAALIRTVSSRGARRISRSLARIGSVLALARVRGSRLDRGTPARNRAAARIGGCLTAVRPAAGVAAPDRGWGIAEDIDAGIITRRERAAKISIACRRAARSVRVREAMATALLAAGAIEPRILDLPPGRIERALKIIAPRLLVGSPAHASITALLCCRAPRSVEMFLRRHPELLDAVRAELEGAQR